MPSVESAWLINLTLACCLINMPSCIFKAANISKLSALTCVLHKLQRSVLVVRVYTKVFTQRCTFCVLGVVVLVAADFTGDKSCRI